MTPRERRTALAKFSTDQLRREVRVRERRTTRAIARRYCDDCRHFRIGDSATCVLNLAMDFRTPRDYSEAHTADWGYFRLRCNEFARLRDA